MPKRKSIGTKNRIGQTVVALREKRNMDQKDLLVQMQTHGCDIGQSSLSDLEGQKRAATDEELWAPAKIFDVAIEELYNKEEM